MSKIKEFFKKQQKSIDIFEKQTEIIKLNSELPSMLRVHEKIDDDTLYIIPFKGTNLYLPGFYLKDVFTYSEKTVKNVVEYLSDSLTKLKNEIEK